MSPGSIRKDGGDGAGGTIVQVRRAGRGTASSGPMFCGSLAHRVPGPQRVRSGRLSFRNGRHVIAALLGEDDAAEEWPGVCVRPHRQMA